MRDTVITVVVILKGDWSGSGESPYSRETVSSGSRESPGGVSLKRGEDEVT
jgi:hypothetical protein